MIVYGAVAASFVLLVPLRWATAREGDQPKFAPAPPHVRLVAAVIWPIWLLGWLYVLTLGRR